MFQKSNNSTIMLLQPPPTLLNIMGVWATVTGLVGVLANGAAICLFCRAGKVKSYYYLNIFKSIKFKLRTPFNWLLMNLSLTELIIACSGNSILAFNSFHRRWTLSNFACQANAFGMTFLGKFAGFFSFFKKLRRQYLNAQILLFFL
jgi:hypothetical protein